MSALNKKRLTKKQVKEILQAEGQLHEELTAIFREDSVTWTDAPKIYSLSNNRFLFVFDENDISTPGKGDIYSKEEIFRQAEWLKDLRIAAARGGCNSIDDWLHYSKIGHQLIEHVEPLINELCTAANMSSSKQERNYRSLIKLSEFLRSLGYQKARDTYFDHVVAYVGEVLRIRSEGMWHISRNHLDDTFPSILGAKGEPEMMPINIVWEALDALGNCELRQLTINEYRSYCRTFKSV